MTHIPGLPQVHTVYDLNMYSAKKYAKTEMLGKRTKKPDGSAGRYEWITYEQADAQSRAIASGLLNQGCDSFQRCVQINARADTELYMPFMLSNEIKYDFISMLFLQD